MSTKTLTSLIVEANDATDEEYSNAQWCAWLNDALDDLSDITYLVKKSTISAEVDGGFTVPADLRTILRVDGVTYTCLPQLQITDDTSVGYHIIGEEIYLQGDAATSIVLTYTRMPAKLSTGAATAPIDVPDFYSSAMVLYACMRAMAREDETERYGVFKEMYMQARSIVANMAKKTRPGQFGVFQVVR